MEYGHDTGEEGSVDGVRHCEESRSKWQKIGMRAEDATWVEEVTKLLEQEPTRLDFLEEVITV